MRRYTTDYTVDDIYYSHREGERNPELKEERRPADKGERMEIMTKMMGIKIDRDNKELQISPRYNKKASVVGSPEFMELIAAKKKYPDYQLKVTTNADKQTYEGLTIPKMRKLISDKWLNEKISEARMNELLSELGYIIEESKSHDKRGCMNFPYVRSWFLKLPEFICPAAKEG